MNISSLILQSARGIIDNVDRNLHRSIRSGKPSASPSTTDLDEIVKKLVSMNVFEHQQGRHYKHFNNFSRDPLSNLDMSCTYKWINEHKKKLASGTNAR